MKSTVIKHNNNFMVLIDGLWEIRRQSKFAPTWAWTRDPGGEGKEFIDKREKAIKFCSSPESFK